MRRTVWILICLLALLFVFMLLLFLCSCKAKEQNDPMTQRNQTVTFVNDLQDADVWILADTQANRKTTVWGTATVSDVKAGESRQALLCEPGDDGRYMFRMIDVDSFFYSVNAIGLEEGWTVRIREDASRSVTLEVSDENGSLNNAYKVFSARL